MKVALMENESVVIGLPSGEVSVKRDGTDLCYHHIEKQREICLFLNSLLKEKVVSDKHIHTLSFNESFKDVFLMCAEQYEKEHTLKVETPSYEHVEHPSHYNGYDMEELKEIWKPVVGYEGIYEVSNIGRIKSLDRMKKSIYGQIVPHKGRFVKQSMHKGYCYVSLTKNGKSTRYCVHRLVAIAFIDNPHNKPMIDHINTNRSDNRVDNLRWVTQRENILNPISLASRSGKNHYNYGKKFSDDFREKLCKSHKSEYKPVLQIDKNTGEVIMEHESVKAAAIHAGVKYDTMSKCLSGITKSCKGYYWKRKPIEKKAKTYEMVNSPKHYSNFTCETIAMMVAIWGKERVADWCEITAFKYRMRMGTKPDNSIEQDLKKEQWYLNKAKELRDERVE